MSSSSAQQPVRSLLVSKAKAFPTVQELPHPPTAATDRERFEPFSVQSREFGGRGIFTAVLPDGRTIETSQPIVKRSEGGVCKSSGAAQSTFDLMIEYERRRQNSAPKKPPTVREARKAYGQMQKEIRHKAKALRAEFNAAQQAKAVAKGPTPPRFPPPSTSKSSSVPWRPDEAAQSKARPRDAQGEIAYRGSRSTPY